VTTSPRKSEDMIVPSSKAREWEEASCILGDGNLPLAQEPSHGFFYGYNQCRRSPVESMNTQTASINPIQITGAGESTTTHLRDTQNDEELGELSAGLNVKNTDIVISFVGPTGVGKSTFLNTALGEDVAAVGHNLTAQTTQLQAFVLRHPKDFNRRIVLVDTPGFNDIQGSADDRDTLRRIGDWMTRR